MQRHVLIPAPSYDVLSDDWHQTVPGGPEPVMYTNVDMVEPIPFREVPHPPRDSDFNTRPSRFQLWMTRWWPGESTWQEVHQPLFKTELPQPLAAMPQGRQLALGQRGNIRRPDPWGQGDLQDASELLASEGV